MSARRTGTARAVACAVAVWAGAPAAAQTALDERQQHVATIVTGEIEKVVGPAGRNCGIYTLTGVDAPSPVGRRQVTEALRCVREAQRRGQGAWAIWQVPDVDAILFDGIGASAVSAIHTVAGRGSNADVVVAPCLEPRVTREATIECANRRPRSARDLARLRRALERDVERTSGLRWEDVAPPPAEPSGDDASAAIADVAAAVQRGVHAAGVPDWPRCPHHFDHPLTFRDGWWYCEREAAFVAAAGRLSTVVPRVRRRR